MDNKNLIQITDEILKTEASSISAEISSKLNLARQKALRNKTKSFRLLSWHIPVTAVLAFAIYLVLPYTSSSNQTNDESYAVIEQMEMLDQYELIEDLEFYQWLSKESEQHSI